MKIAANEEIARRRQERVADRMREVTLHQLCVIVFEQEKEKEPYPGRAYSGEFRFVPTHGDDEREAARTEIRRRIKKPEVGALGDDRKRENEDVQ
jgi:hypothetical protein